MELLELLVEGAFIYVGTTLDNRAPSALVLNFDEKYIVTPSHSALTTLTIASMIPPWEGNVEC